MVGGFCHSDAAGTEIKGRKKLRGMVYFSLTVINGKFLSASSVLCPNVK